MQEKVNYVNKTVKMVNMDLEQARLHIEKILNKNICNKDLANALSMSMPSISRKLSEKTKLKYKQARMLEDYFGIKLDSKNFDGEICENNSEIGRAHV